MNIRFSITPGKQSRKLLKEVDKAMSALEPALKIIKDNVPHFQQKSPREIFSFLVLESAFRLASMETAQREQPGIIRDLLLHFDQTGLPSLDVIEKEIRRQQIDASEEKLNLTNLMQQLDSQLGTNYLLTAQDLSLCMARSMFFPGQFSPAQQAFVDQLKRQPTKVGKKTIKPGATPAESGAMEGVDELLMELDSLIGLRGVKQDVRELVNFLNVQKMREKKGLAPAQVSRHLVFYGNPGTGKTTIARLLAKIYRALGLLSTGQFVEADRSALVAGYLGQTALKVQGIVEKATGGVLFIDEAYALSSDDHDSFGQEAIDTLLKLMEDKREDLIVIVAGYPTKMEKFIHANPGLRSRFNKYFSFEDYSPEEMLQIFEHFCLRDGFRVNEDARQRLTALLTNLFDNRNEQFGNGRDVRNLFEQAISNQANRIISLKRINQKALEELKAEDIPQEPVRSHLIS